MPATYEPIATTTLSSAASSISLTSIPGTFTDLRITATIIGATGPVACYLRFNSDSSTSYSTTSISGNGSSASSSRSTSALWIYGPNAIGNQTYPGFATYDVQSYAGTTYKTVLWTGSNDISSSGTVERNVSLWRSSSAINAISLHAQSSNFGIGSTVTIYGIKAA